MLATKYFSLNQLHVSSNPSAQKRSQSVAQSTSRRGGGLTWLDCTGDAKSDGEVIQWMAYWSRDAWGGKLPSACRSPACGSKSLGGLGGSWKPPTPLTHANLEMGCFWVCRSSVSHVRTQVQTVNINIESTQKGYAFVIWYMYFILSCSPVRQSRARVIQGARYFLESYISSSISDQSLTQIEYIHECDRIPTWVGRGIDDYNNC